MADIPSLADRAVHALSMVSSIGKGMRSDAPERHIVWDIKIRAETALTYAFDNAIGLANLANDARIAVQDAIKDAEKKEPTND